MFNLACLICAWERDCVTPKVACFALRVANILFVGFLFGLQKSWRKTRRHHWQPKESRSRHSLLLPIKPRSRKQQRLKTRLYLCDLPRQGRSLTSRRLQSWQAVQCQEWHIEGLTGEYTYKHLLLSNAVAPQTLNWNRLLQIQIVVRRMSDVKINSKLTRKMMQTMRSFMSIQYVHFWASWLHSHNIRPIHSSERKPGFRHQQNHSSRQTPI